MVQKVLAEYIWIDGQEPTKKLRSKTRVLDLDYVSLKHIPSWTSDGSSTMQADTHRSDIILKPVNLKHDPIRGEPHYLVLCEVYGSNGKPHKSNTRAALKRAAKKFEGSEPWFGIEQEYTLYDRDGVRPLRWPEGAGFPAPQGKYYCGVGSDEVHGRELVEAHLKACLEAKLEIAGINAEVMPAQWEFQVGPLPTPEIADQLWLARWLLYRIGENYGISAKLDPKPIAGDWNGAGAHTNFSTKQMRGTNGIHYIEEACRKLGMRHSEHISVYGADNAKRLSGKHETCDIDTFRWGVSDRGASVRIPLHVANAGQGYLEDRRPAANADPYKVCTAILETVCGKGFSIN